MAKREHSYIVAHPLEAVRALAADAQAVGRALAFVETTEWVGGQWLWRLPAALAAITGAEGLQVDFQVAGDQVRWTGRSPRLISRGELCLRPAGPGATAIDLTFEMAGVGVASAVIEPLASMQIEGQMDHLISRLEADLQSLLQKEALNDGNRSRTGVGQAA